MARIAGLGSGFRNIVTLPSKWAWIPEKILNEEELGETLIFSPVMVPCALEGVDTLAKRSRLKD